LLAFCDGKVVKPMVPSQDHKRIFDGDKGPNTGGMGAYAPVPVCPPALVDELVHTILQPAIDGLRDEERPFVGTLYTGLMLTTAGPRVIEFNCRFGDPEAQVVLPLLETDFLDVAEACAEGRLAEVDVRWKNGAAAGVVLASGGYPGRYPTGCEISGLEAAGMDALVFHAGTKLANGEVVTAGGRVLCVTGLGNDIHQALHAAYARIEGILFEGMQYRKDIGWRILGGEQ
jgi:phosphoribosylamine--glycine ligase